MHVCLYDVNEYFSDFENLYNYKLRDSVAIELTICAVKDGVIIGFGNWQ